MWERRPFPPCALRAFDLVSNFFCLVPCLIEIRFSVVDSCARDEELDFDDFVTPWGVPNPSSLVLKPSDSRAPSS